MRQKGKGLSIVNIHSKSEFNSAAKKPTSKVGPGIGLWPPKKCRTFEAFLKLFCNHLFLGANFQHFFRQVLKRFLKSTRLPSVTSFYLRGTLWLTK